MMRHCATWLATDRQRWTPCDGFTELGSANSRTWATDLPSALQRTVDEQIKPSWYWSARSTLVQASRCGVSDSVACGLRDLVGGVVQPAESHAVSRTFHASRATIRNSSS